MDINSKIKWTPGMPLSAQTLSFLDEAFSKRKEAFVKAVLGARTGILPGAAFSCDAMFVGSNIEIEIRNCQAWLPSGRLMDIVEDKTAVAVPDLDDGDYYICAAFSEKMVDFESKGVVLERPVYEYSIQDESALKNNVAYLPFIKITVLNRNVSIDKDYIAPMMQLEGDARLVGLSRELASAIEAYSAHPNLADGVGKSMIQYFNIISKYYNERTDTNEYLSFTIGLINIIRHFFLGSGETDTEMIPYIYDVHKWMKQVFALISESTEYLDSLVIEDTHIDYDKLRTQITEDVYARIKAETEEQLSAMADKMGNELAERLQVSIREFIEGEFKNVLHDRLRTEISDELAESLYKSLYDALYGALFVPEKEEDIYTPII